LLHDIDMAINMLILASMYIYSDVNTVLSPIYTVIYNELMVTFRDVSCRK